MTCPTEGCIVQQIRIGFCGSGHIASAYGAAFLNSAMTFGPKPAAAVLEAVWRMPENDSTSHDSLSAFRRTTNHWRELAADPEIDALVVATSVDLRPQITHEAIRNGKHVYCAAPLAESWASVRDLAKAAERSSVVAMVGFTFLHNPIQALSYKLVSGGELGDLVFYRGTFDQEVGTAGHGRAMGLCIHPISIALRLVGPIARVCAASAGSTSEGRTTHEAAAASDLEVMCEFESGALGHIACSSAGSGREIGLTYEIQGTQGAVCFSQERMNELDLYRRDGRASEHGYTTIYAGPEHASYGAFHPVAGVALGHNDLMTIEAREFILAIAEKRSPTTDFRFAGTVDRVRAAVAISTERGEWVSLSEIGEDLNR